MQKTNISSGTIARTIVLALALINQLLAAFGHSPIPIEDDTINQLVSTAWTVVAAVVAWWKNNSLTPMAQEADTVLQDLKKGYEIGGCKGTVASPQNNKGTVQDAVPEKEVHK